MVPGPPAARGWVCSSDNDPACPYARCIAGSCGGCLGDQYCKPGNACMSSPYGYQCVPRPATYASPNATPLPGPANTTRYATERRLCVEETNRYRAQLNLAPLTQRFDQEACADEDARGDAATGKAHGGSGNCHFKAQNECPGWPGAEASVVTSCLKMMFNEGPGEPYIEHGHYINMTRPHYTGVACGVYRHSDGKLWVVQNFY